MKTLQRVLPILTLLAAASPCAANSADSARADELFRSGKAALARGELLSACAQLKESYQLDEATGSLLALALCHERSQNLEAALAEYRIVAKRARNEGNTGRVRAAEKKVIDLEAQVPSVIVYLTYSSATDEVDVKLNGTALTRDQVGQRIAVAGSVALIEASAPGKQPWRTSIPVAVGSVPVAVTVPVLVADPSLAPVVALAPISPAPKAPPVRVEPKRPRDKGPVMRWTGIGLTSAGVVGLALAGGFTIRAARLRNDSNATDSTGLPRCDGNACTAEGRDLRLDARSAGTVATISVAAGATLAATGIVTYMLGRSRSQEERRARAPRVRASAWASPSSAGALLQGNF